MFEVDVRGVDVLHRKLNAGSIFTSVKDGMVREAAFKGRDTATEKSKGQFGRKGLAGRIVIDFTEGGLIANVHPNRQIMGIALTMEEGRRPGRRPPYTPIKKWLMQGGVISGAKGDSGIVRQVQNTIKEQGTRGIRYMEQAAEEANRTLRQRGPPTEREIERQWNA